MKSLLILALVSVLGVVYFFTDADHSIVEIEYIAKDEAKPLAYVEVILGDDKAKVVDIAPNKVKSVRMKPSKDSLPILSGSIYLHQETDSRTSAWMGEDHHPRGENIRVRASINESGEFIAEKSCKLPCSFD
jgi:hypothetical protein